MPKEQTQHILIMCGGASYEHEVSIITGLQIAENIDTSLYTYSFIYFDQTDQVWWLPNFTNRKDFLASKRLLITFGKDNHGAFFQTTGWFGKKIYFEAGFLGFHGGSGESGPVQGLLELLNVPFTSASQEGAVIAMNKSLTKEVLRDHGVSVLPSMTIFSAEYQQSPSEVIAEVQQKLTLPIIIKPAHLGSSIGISIAKTNVDLEKYLDVATRIDTEVLVEPALQDFVEYNVSVRPGVDGLEYSPIEEPVRADEILSFDDKYANGSKKTGSKSSKNGGGMELLDRKLPAAISQTLERLILTTAAEVYRAARLSGLVRIDFMYHNDTLYCTEINPIPGSVSFYLWEAAGEQFSEQITKALQSAQKSHAAKIKVEPYHSDIIEKFIG